MNPSTKQHMKLPVNVHYHATVACIKMKDQKFEPTNIIIPDTLKEKLSAQNVPFIILYKNLASPIKHHSCIFHG